MTVARGGAGDVSATAVTAAGRKAGQGKTGQVQEAGGFAAAMRDLGAAPGDKRAAASTNSETTSPTAVAHTTTSPM